MIYPEAIRISAVLILCLSTAAAAEVSPRIHGRIQEKAYVALGGGMPPLPGSGQDLGPVSGDLVLPSLTLHFSMTPAQNSDLLQLLAQQQNRSSKEFHKWLTPEDFGARFGLSESDIQKVQGWLEASGFTNIAAARSRNFITFSGTAMQAEAAFHVNLHRYQRNGASYYANASAPEIPSDLAGIVQSIRGFDNFSSALSGGSAARSSVTAKPRQYNGSPNRIGLGTQDIYTIYDMLSLTGSGVTGSGRKIAVAGQADIDSTVVAGFLGNPLQVVVAGTDPGFNGPNEELAEIEVEWAGAMAHGATVIYVNSTDTLTSVQYAIQNNLADVLTFQDQQCESDVATSGVSTRNALFQQASAQGITIVTPATPVSCQSVTANPGTSTYPLSASAVSPYVTAVGATSFNDATGTYYNSSGNAISYISEMAGGGYSLGGSNYNTKPTWQAGVNVPNDKKRDIPDVSFFAGGGAYQEGYFACVWPNGCIDNANADSLQVGGAELPSACWAGIIAMLDQQTNQRQGNINSNLYALASVSSDAFHVVPPGVAQGYAVATGLGTPDVANLLREWGSDFQISANPTSLSVTRGASGTATITVTPTANFPGTVSFTCSVSGTLTNTTCAVPGSITAHTGTVTVTVSAGTTASTLGWPRTRNPFGVLPAAVVTLAGLCWLLRTRWRQWPAFAAGLCTVLVLSLVGCGSNSSSGTAETGSITISGNSGVIAHTASLAVTVQ